MINSRRHHPLPIPIKDTNMKKVLTALVALSISTVALADDSRGFYVQGDVGHSTVKAKTGEDSGKVKGFSPRLSAGYDFGDFRVAADYTHYKNFKLHEEDSLSSSDYKVKFQSVGVSAIYDFDLNSPVKPYVGARVGVNRVSFDDHFKTATYSETETYRKTKTGLGVMAGVGYDVTENVALDAGYRYNHWGKFDGLKVHSHEVSAGVRVKF